MLQGTCPTLQTLEMDSCWRAEEWKFPGEGAGKKERGELLFQKLPGICLVALKITQDTSRLTCPSRMPSTPSADSRGVGARVLRSPLPSPQQAVCCHARTHASVRSHKAGLLAPARLSGV